MPDLFAAVLYGLAIASMYAWRIGRRDREIRYLRKLAGNRNLWNVRCDVCCKPLRDRPTATDTTLHNDGHQTSISYHLWGGCAEIVRKRQETP
ncbi:hypothetical protein ABTX80_24855 [Streptomyces erythrochromogenes]|uniref:hypothetical protein n=1 Tax=Streptomyces erythrochromogenes TaxID=285574 RepID=UPI0033181AE6